MKRSLRIPLLFCAAAFGLTPLAACTDDVADSEDASADSVAAVPAVSTNDLPAVAARDPRLTTVRTALTATDLIATLQGEGPFTVFAPTDDAFNALPAGAVQSMLREQNRDELRRTLTYHVVPARIMSGDLTGSMTVATVHGGSLTLGSDGESVTVTDGMGHTARIVTPDVDASNGVIHVIDGVLMPGDATAPADSAATRM